MKLYRTNINHWGFLEFRINTSLWWNNSDGSFVQFLSEIK